MRLAVEGAIVDFQAKFEGVVPWMYLDCLGLVTVAIGNLVDPLAAALSLPFVHADGTPATRAEIVAEWQAVKSDPLAAKKGHLYTQHLTTLRLTPDGVRTVVFARIRQNEIELTKRIPAFAELPAPAQLGLHSWAWAGGPGGVFPKFFAALNAGDFVTASVECYLNDKGADRIAGNADDNWGLKPRNAANKQLFLEAASATDPDTLSFVSAAHVVPPETHKQTSQEAIVLEGGVIHPDYDWASLLPTATVD